MNTKDESSYVERLLQSTNYKFDEQTQTYILDVQEMAQLRARITYLEFELDAREDECRILLNIMSRMANKIGEAKYQQGDEE